MIAKVSGGYKATTEGGRPLSKRPRSKKAAIRQLRAVEANKHGSSRHALATVDTLNVLRKNVPMEAVPARKKVREKASRYLSFLKGRSGSYTRRFARSNKPVDAMVLAGKLYLSESGWGLLQIPNAMIRGLFDAISEPGVILPPQDSDLPRARWKLNAHVSVLRPDEIEAAGGPGTITEWGHHFRYQIGPIKKVIPASWDGMKEVYFVDIDSPELEEMRAKYGLSRLPNKGKFRFHATVAVKPTSRGAGKVRFAKAGSPTTCGNSRSEGQFTPGNVCATGRRPDQLNDEASERAKRWIETPAGKAAIAASKAPVGRQTVGPFGKALRSVGVKASPEQATKIASVYFAVHRESKRAAHGDRPLTLAINGIDVAVLRWLGGHVDDLGPIGKVIGTIPMGALAYLLQSDSPSLKTARRARIAVQETMKRIKGKSKDEPATFRRIKHTDKEDMTKAARHIEKYGDYYLALLLAALERSFGDLKVSVRVADHAYQGETAEAPSPISRHTKLSPGKPVVGKRAKAGSPEDCGHRPVSGHFDSKNSCAVIHGRLARREKAAGIVHEPARDESPHESPADSRSPGAPAGGKVGFVKAAYGRIKALFGKANHHDRGILRRAADALKVAYGKLRRGRDAEREMQFAADMLKVEERRIARHSRSGDCGHDPTGDFATRNTCASGGGSGKHAGKAEAAAKELASAEKRGASESKLDGLRRNLEYFRSKSEGPKTIDHGQFLSTLRDAASKVDPSRVRGTGKAKVWVADLWDQFRKLDPGLSYDEFKDELSAMSRERRVDLARHDMPHALSPEELETSKRSEVNPKDNSRVAWHFVTFPRNSRHSLRERIARFESQVKAGSAEDCGHRVKGGLFDKGNDCAKGGSGKMSDKNVPHLKNWVPGWRASESDLSKEFRGILTPEEISAVTSPEQWNRMLRYVRAAIDNKAGYLPTKDELKVLAKLGQSARGQYEFGGKFLRAMYGKFGEEGEKVARFWEAANSIFSARTGWKIHSGTATMMTDLWIEAGMPTGDSPESAAKIAEIIKTVKDYEKPNGALAFPFDDTKAEKIAEVMKNADQLVDDKKFKNLIADGSWGKTVNFGESWRDSEASAIDSWMGAATTPENIFDDDKTSIKLDQLMDMTSDGQLSGKAEVLDKKLRNARADVMSDPGLYNAYKMLIGKTAKEIGWEPRQVQETAWSALMGIGLLRAAGVKSKDLVDKFTHELARNSWDMEGVFSGKLGQELLGDGLRDSTLDTLKKWAKRTTAPRRRKSGRVELDPGEKELATRVAERVPAAATATKVGRKVEVPDEQGGLRTLANWPEPAMTDTREITKAKNRLRRAKIQISGLGSQIGEAEKKMKKYPHNPNYAERRAELSRKYRETEKLVEERTQLYLEEKSREEKAKKSRKRSRRSPSRFEAQDAGAMAPVAMGEQANQYDANPDRQFLSSEQVGHVIANQHHNKAHGRYTTEEAERHWTASTLYKLMKVPAWLPSPYRFVRADDPSHSKGPIIVDLTKNPLRKRLYGSFGQDTNVCVLDGKHRLSEYKREHGDGDIEAFIGVSAIPEIKRYLGEFGPKRAAFVAALDEFYEDPKSKWRPLIVAARNVGLSDDQIRLIREHRLQGSRFSPAEGRFISAVPR